MIRRRILALGQGALSLLLVLAAVGIVVHDVREVTTADAPIDVGQDAAVEIVVSASDAAEKVTGTFRVESVRDYPRLEPATEYADPLQRKGGRVVVAVIRCDCPVGDDLYPPTELVMDAEGRRWESPFLVDLDDYAETAGLPASYDIGESRSFRYGTVFVVPAEVAGSVRVVLQRLGPGYRFAR